MQLHKLFLVGAVLLLVGERCFAGEHQLSHQLNHSLQAYPDQSPIFPATSRALPDTIRLLAVMVEFQPDTDPLTTGTGQFGSAVASGSVVDPAPHDRLYFERHLRFLENYWHHVTNGSLSVVANLVDTVIQLSHPMRYYSPPSSSLSNTELGFLVQDTWMKVDSVRSSIDFTRYDAFCIFHAGVGRDIDLTSLFGYDPSPFDIPSLYMNLNGLRRAFGLLYPGVLVRDSLYITNSMILPETESRFLPSIGGEVLLQLGINGLLAASFGSHLGLPDLFDTRTGRSGIGRFGLMDGQSIFSWNGVFPPEPSAWEKYHLEQRYRLGLVKVVDVPSGQSALESPAATLRVNGLDTLFRITVSPKEYFLVENRNRDAKRDGAQVLVAIGSDSVWKTFLRDTTGFNAFDQSSIAGVVMDVDEFDWSLPGGVSNTGEFFDGGMLIWHVDEDVIDQGYATNTINADPNRRGVDLEEADGSQDIGQSYGFLDPGSGSEDGTPIDFWYNGNSSPVYQNSFSITSYPNSSSNSGGNSHIVINTFSERAPTMSFVVHVGDSLVKSLPGYPKFVARARGDNSPQMSTALFVSVGDSVFAFRPDSGMSATPDSRGLFSARGGRFPLAFLRQSNDTTIAAGTEGSSLYIWRAIDVDGNRVFDDIRETRIDFSSPLTTSPAVALRSVGSNLIPTICVGDSSGNVYLTAPDGTNRDSVHIGSSPVLSIALYNNTSSASIPDSFIVVTNNLVWSENDLSFTLPHSSVGWQIVLQDDRILLADVGAQTLIALDRTMNVLYQRTWSVQDGKLSPLAVADIDGDGMRDVVFGIGKKLWSLNRSGATIDHFPILLPAPLSGAPVVARLLVDRRMAHILASTTDGLLVGYDSRGKIVQGFPLALGATSISTPALFELPQGALSFALPAVFVTDTSGFISGWALQLVPFGLVIPWGSYRGDVSHTGSDRTALFGTPLSQEFLPASRAYNWPNPVYAGKTFIRYFLQKDATVRIKIFDLDGQVVDEFGGPGVGGLDNEIEWNVSRVQSGVYFGRIEAQSAGQSGSAIIKIAVVR